MIDFIFGALVGASAAVAVPAVYSWVKAKVVTPVEAKAKVVEADAKKVV